eukprot:6167189-Lingulodinium_polyedra.AAC.1
MGPPGRRALRRLLQGLRPWRDQAAGGQEAGRGAQLLAKAAEGAGAMGAEETAEQGPVAEPSRLEAV